jgi:hypothetical protein
MVKFAGSERRELINRNRRTVHQNLACRGTETLDRLSHVIGDAMDEISNLKDALESNATLWVLEGFNLLGCTAATHSDFCSPM